ncbi:MAG: AAA family ATPase [Candidatus Riflebacteria bacterium]|nr:AAA family ATPase [Candidatus Riflebacteria bacterium]
MHVRSFRSISRAVVDLGPLTFLVGANGSGKSNTVDVLRFVSDSLNTTLESALRERGGINAVRRRSRGHPNHFSIRLEFRLPDARDGSFSFEIAAEKQGGFSVRREACELTGGLLGDPVRYEVRDGSFFVPVAGIQPRLAKDRLALTAISGHPDFRPVYDLLTGIRTYNLVPDKVRELQDADPGNYLKRDGGNAAAVLREIRRVDEAAFARINGLLSKVVMGTQRVEPWSLGPKESLRFFQDVGDKAPWTFEALNMSDGTLRVVAILIAIFQVPSPPLIAIEEPESTIHPAAVEVLLDAFRDGVFRTQILATTHSPEMLDSKSITDSEIRAVSAVRGQTSIGPVNSTTRSVIRDRLYSPGELLRAGELVPGVEETAALDKQLRLFRDDEADCPNS